MISTINHNFISNWNESNSHLQDTIIEKVSKFFLRSIHKYCMELVLPAQKFPKDYVLSLKENMLDCHQNMNILQENIHIRTPDGADINGCFLKQEHLSSKSPIIIFNQPNGAACYQQYFHYIIKEIAEKKYNFNFIIYDYRGCGESISSPLGIKDLILDCDSVYQFAMHHLGVAPSNIHMMGLSLGGAISAYVKEMHPECMGKYVNDRSFSTLKEVISCLNTINWVIKKIAQFFLHFLGYGILNAKKSIEQIQSETLVIFHPRDEIIKDFSQIQFHVNENQINVKKINLENLERNINYDHYHTSPLYNFRGHSHEYLHQEVVHFFSRN